MKNNVAILLAAGLIAASSAAFAGPNLDTSVAYDRDLRAQSQHETANPCAPANGAQIMGGFAAAGDSIDAATGRICGHR